jgi:hypothetical protein
MRRLSLLCGFGDDLPLVRILRENPVATTGSPHGRCGSVQHVATLAQVSVTLIGDFGPNVFGGFALLAVERKSYEKGFWAFSEQTEFAGQGVESFASCTGTCSVGHLGKGGYERRL